MVIDQQQKNRALTVKCSYCGAQPGQPCRNTQTAQPLKFTAAHTPRLHAAHNTDPDNQPF